MARLIELVANEAWTRYRRQSKLKIQKCSCLKHQCYVRSVIEMVGPKLRFFYKTCKSKRCFSSE